ncbi:hypothetical protein [Bythopirellula goksoeyrii]|nr:hypothetical protein [Bythopirellula goksoeyrii]
MRLATQGGVPISLLLGGNLPWATTARSYGAKIEGIGVPGAASPHRAFGTLQAGTTALSYHSALLRS